MTKRPKTRIKVITDKDGDTRYYAEYNLGFIWGWQCTRPSITSSDYVLTLEDAQSRIDDFLRRDFHRRTSEAGKTGRKSKRIVKIINYPDTENEHAKD